MRISSGRERRDIGSFGGGFDSGIIFGGMTSLVVDILLIV